MHTELLPVRGTGDLPATVSEPQSCSWLQRVFGYCPEPISTPSVISSGPAAPATASEMQTWTVEQMYSHSAREQIAAIQGYTSGSRQTASDTGGAEGPCHWYESEQPDGSCRFPSKTVVIVAAGAVLALMLVRR